MSANLAQIVDNLSALTVIEAAELSKMLEEKWAFPPPLPSRSPLLVALLRCCSRRGKDRVLRDPQGCRSQIRSTNQHHQEVRAVTGLGLKEAKDLVEGAPKEVKGGVNKDEAAKIKKLLEDNGAKVEVK